VVVPEFLISATRSARTRRSEKASGSLNEQHELLIIDPSLAEIERLSRLGQALIVLLVLRLCPPTRMGRSTSGPLGSTLKAGLGKGSPTGVRSTSIPPWHVHHEASLAVGRPA
jgi:hypothetical protein